MTELNKRLAAVLKNIAACYKFLGGDNPFRAIAYDKAARFIANLPEDITVYIEKGTTEDIPGVGESIAEDIAEFASTGKISRFEKLKTQVPVNLLDLMEISGFGPQSLKTIAAGLNLQTKDEIIDALQSGRISKLKGFGAKKIENMLRGLKLHKTAEERMPLWSALAEGKKMVAYMQACPGVSNVALGGSLRRGKENIGDIDILVATGEKNRKKVADFFSRPAVAGKVLAKGLTKVSVVLKDTKRQADLRIVSPEEWGSALQYFTGSKEHNIHLRTLAREKGLKISEYGVFRIEDNKRLAGETEKEVYDTLTLQWIPPEMRENKGEIELAAKRQLPRLVTVEDVKGDLQMHSTWSDGLSSLEEIAAYVREHFNYEYIAITDHSKSSRIAHGMDEKGFLDQIKAIKQINQRLGADFLKTGAEVDILPDGSLDLSDEVLAQLDWVTASVHSGFRRDNTARLIKACENPWVHCIGHPTGRLIGKREAYPVNIRRLAEAASETGTALEINAQPDRMDLNDNMASVARETGAMLVISTDSHKPTDFSFMELGVTIARRAWCTAANILNTREWKDVRRFTEEKSKKQAVHA